MKFGLILQTITKNPFIILSKNETVYKIIYTDPSKKPSLGVFSSLQEIFRDKKALHYVATSVGPGSFTNIRVGATLASAIAYSLNIPLIGFSSLEMIQPANSGNFINLLDAQSSGIYIQKGEKTPFSLFMEPPEIVTVTTAQILCNTTPFLFSLDDNLSLNKKLQTDKIQSGVIDPQYITQMTYDSFSKKNYTKNNTLELLYMRHS